VAKLKTYSQADICDAVLDDIGDEPHNIQTYAVFVGEEEVELSGIVHLLPGLVYPNLDDTADTPFAE
jgi:hypothetical protein